MLNAHNTIYYNKINYRWMAAHLLFDSWMGEEKEKKTNFGFEL